LEFNFSKFILKKKILFSKQTGYNLTFVQMLNLPSLTNHCQSNLQHFEHQAQKLAEYSSGLKTGPIKLPGPSPTLVLTLSAVKKALHVALPPTVL
jgi:hypothetical protein